PYLVSIKKLYYSNEFLCFSIDLNEVYGYDDLQFRVLRLSIFLFSGQRFEYSFEEKFNISDIWINEDCYSGFEFIELGRKRNQHNKFTREKYFKEIKTDSVQNRHESTVIYEKNSIKSVSVDESIISMIQESNNTLKNIEQHLKNLNLTLQNASLTSFQDTQPLRLPNGDSGIGIERIKRPPNPNLIQRQISSGKLMVIQEMKTIFKQNIEKNSDFNVKDILKPLTEEELNMIILDDEILQEREMEAINNQIKRFEKERQKEKEIKLENLKKPN
ncbi:MAG: hypothetical protein ACFFD7_14420, partial [Candidatus Thorarchaeota archaeon]